MTKTIGVTIATNRKLQQPADDTEHWGLDESVYGHAMSNGASGAKSIIYLSI